MTLVVGSITDAARDRHAAFDRNRNPAKMVRRFLAAYARELAGKIERVDETAFLTEDSFTLPLADFSAGFVLPAHRYLAGAVATLSNGRGTYPIDIIPWGQRDARNTKLASAWEVNGVLYLNGEASSWSNVDSVAVSYAPILGDLATEDDTLPLPDTCENALVENVALFMARRGHNDPRLPAIDVGMFASVAAAAEANFLSDVMNNVSGQHFRVADVWP